VEIHPADLKKYPSLKKAKDKEDTMKKDRDKIPAKTVDE